MNEIFRPRAGTWPLAWAFLLSLCVFLQGFSMAMHIPLGEPPDELAHASYLKDAIHSDAGLPNYTAGKIVNSSRLNYLAHPPLYYSTLGVIGKVAQWDPIRDFKAFRLVGLVFVTLGFLFFILSARNLGVGLWPAVIMTIGCCATPMYSYLAGSINNDTLMYLGVALFVFGVTRSRMIPGHIDPLSLATLVIGLVTAALTKATAAAFIVFFVTAFALLAPRESVALIRDKMLLIGMAAVLVVCSTYYAYALTVFGTPFPRPSALYEIAPPAHPLGIAPYTLKYAASMWDRLPAIVSHASISPYTEITKWFFYVMLVTPVAAWITSRPYARSRGMDEHTVRITDAFMLALAATVLAHILYVRDSYLSTGLFAGWQPRYYLFAIPFLWSLFYGIESRPSRTAAVSIIFSAFAFFAFWTSSPLVLAEHTRNSTRSTGTAAQKRNSIVKLSAGTIKAAPVGISVSFSGGSVGHVDELTIDSGTLRVRGWAVDSGTGYPARRVWILGGNRYLGSTQPRLQRPDVAKALKNPRSGTSGFSIAIEQLPSNMLECQIQIGSEGADGGLTMLRDSSC